MSYAYFVKGRDIRQVVPVFLGWRVLPSHGCTLGLEALSFPIVGGDKDGLYISADNEIECDGCTLDVCIFVRQKKGEEGENGHA